MNSHTLSRRPRPRAVALPAASPWRTAAVALLASLAVTSMVLVALVGLASPASAHDRLLSSDPADGAELETPPAAITLTFNTTPLEVEPRVVVTDAAGDTVADGAPVIDGTDAVLALPDPLPGGDYDVAWRVVSSDGHPIEGTFAFTVAEQPEPEPTEEPTTEEPAPTDTTETVEEPTETEPVEPTVTETDDASTEDGDGSSALPLVVGLGALVVVAAVTAVLVVRRRGSGDDAGPTSGNDGDA